MATTRNSKALEKFAELMIEKINQVSDNWQKPWITNPVGQPQNAITGRPYRGLNDLMLFFHAEKRGYKIPAFLTFNQTQDAGANVIKGEHGFPVAYWGKYYVEKDNQYNRITSEQYKKLGKEDQKLYKEKLLLQEYTVFNVQQTSIPQDKPELWEKIQNRFGSLKLRDENGMFVSSAIDEMLKNNSWLCPVNVVESNKAFYRPYVDNITVPLKAQFKDGESFYGTLLHEMAHSTGHESRLKRDMSGFFGNKEYAKEELVAELTAALSASSLGISTNIREENAQYLKNWLGALNEEPKFILSVLSDVHKASTMINDVIQQEEVGKKEEITKTLDDKVIQPVVADISQEETKNLLGLEVGQNYMYGKGNDAREVTLLNVTIGGVFTFKEAKNGVQFKLQSMKDMPFRNIHPIQSDNNPNLSTQEKKQLASASKNGNKSLFEKAEIPKDELKKIGIKVSDLSASDMNRLLAGKETKELSIINSTKGEKITGKISLMRNNAGNVAIIINFAQQQQNKRTLKLS